MHLLDEFFVGERAQIQIIRFFFSHNGKTLREFTLASQSPILWVSLPCSVSAATQHHRIATPEKTRALRSREQANLTTGRILTKTANRMRSGHLGAPAQGIRTFERTVQTGVWDRNR